MTYAQAIEQIADGVQTGNLVLSPAHTPPSPTRTVTVELPNGTAEKFSGTKATWRCVDGILAVDYVDGAGWRCGSTFGPGQWRAVEATEA